LAIKHNDLRAPQCLAAALAEGGNIEESLREFRRAITLTPDDQQMAESYALLATHKDALQQALEKVRSNPDSLNAHYELATAYEASGLGTNAKSEYDKTWRLCWSSKTSYDELGKKCQGYHDADQNQVQTWWNRICIK